MASLNHVPCVHVDCHNWHDIWPQMKREIKSCSFIAFDLELSGLGQKTSFGLKDIDERYEAFIETAKTRAILSFGLSTWRFTGRPPQSKPQLTGKELDVEDPEVEEEEEVSERPFCVGVWNVVCRRTDDSVLEPEAKQFLEDHGFDFERQQECGIPYSTSDRDGTFMHKLWSTLVTSGKPLAVHNGLIDLLFLYHAFHLDVPQTLGTFTAELHDLFPGAIYDTKFITDCVLNFDASFLEYVFYSEQRKNCLRETKNQVFLTLSFITEKDSAPEGSEFRDMKTKMFERNTQGIQVCKHYGWHGWCADGTKCNRSHDIDLILDARSARDKKRKNRMKKKRGQNCNGTVEVENNLHEPRKSDETGRTPLGRVKSGAHRSGFDAFMTGYAFACIISTQCSLEEIFEKKLHKTARLKALADSLFLSGKTFPLKVRKGNFERLSQKHTERMRAIRAQQV